MLRVKSTSFTCRSNNGLGTFPDNAFLLSLPGHPLKSLLLRLSVLPLELIIDDTLLLVFLILQLFLFVDHAALDLNVFQLVAPLNLLELLNQVTAQRGNILIRPKLSSISDNYAAKRALFLALPIVSLDAHRAESMQTSLVDDGIRHQVLANRACQVLLTAFDKVSAYHVVQGERFGHAVPSPVLVQGMIDNLSIQLLLLFLIVIGQLE